MISLNFLIDFDGTITKHDLAFQILEKFSDADWRLFDRQYENGEISLVECMFKQYNTIKGDLGTIQNYIQTVVEFRDGFIEFIEICKKNNWNATVLSAGLDFAIKFCLDKLDLNIPVIAMKTHFQDGYVVVDSNSLEYTEKHDFKAITVLKTRSELSKIIMIGDGSTDRQASEYADHVLTVEGSPLHEYCVNNKINHSTFQDFISIPSIIESLGFEV